MQTTRVITLKASPPVSGGDVIADEIGKAHRYYNRLVELTRELADRLDEAKRRHCPALEPAERAATARKAELADLLGRIKEQNAVERRRRPAPADREATTALRQALRDAYAAVKAARQAAVANAAYQAEVAEIVTAYQGELPDPDATRRAGGYFKAARAACGVYSGTYLRIEAAVEQARNQAFGRPGFRRWDGGGLVGPQLQPPVPLADALAGTTRFKLEFLPSPGSDRRSQRCLAWVRVQSDEAGRPVWAKLPCHLSRGQLAADAVFTWATVVRRQVGVRRHADPAVPEGVWRPYYEWAVQLTVRTESEKPGADAGACGVNLGWRAMIDGSVRVAYVAGSDGRREDVRVPARLLSAFAKARDLQAIRALRFNEMRDALAGWVAGAPVPDWLREATEALGQWRSARRLGGLQGRWAADRFPGDDEVFGQLTAWRVKDTHLEQWQLTAERKARRWRKKLYQAVAAGLRRSYHTILVDDTDLAKLKRRPAADSTETVNETAARNLRDAAPGSLRALLVEAGGRAAAAADITRTCHVCGAVGDPDRAAVVIRCDDCGAEYDQDENAAANLLARAEVAAAVPVAARGPEGAGGEGDGADPPPAGGKWARRKAARSRRRTERGEG